LAVIELLLGLGLALGAGSKVVHDFERRAADDLRSKLTGDAIDIRVRAVPNGPINGASGDLLSAEILARSFSTNGLPLYTEPERPGRGRVRELRLELRDFRLAGLRVESLRATIPDCRYDLGLALSRGQIRLTRSGEGTGTVTLLAEDLGPWITRRFREITEARVEFRAGKVIVEGAGDFIVIKARFKVIAELESPDGRRIELVRPRVWLDGQRVPLSTAQALLQTLNPVVDLDRDLKLDGAVDLQSVHLSQNRLTATGRARIPSRPKPR